MGPAQTHATCIMSLAQTLTLQYILNKLYSFLVLRFVFTSPHFSLFYSLLEIPSWGLLRRKCVPSTPGSCRPVQPSRSLWQARTLAEYLNHLGIYILFTSSLWHPTRVFKGPLSTQLMGGLHGALKLSLQKGLGRPSLLPWLSQKLPQTINRYLARHTWLKVHILCPFCAKAMGPTSL